jgi:hypothetical protein
VRNVAPVGLPEQLRRSEITLLRFVIADTFSDRPADEAASAATLPGSDRKECSSGLSSGLEHDSPRLLFLGPSHLTFILVYGCSCPEEFPVDGRGVPDSDCLVTRGGNDPRTIRAEGCREDRIGLAL